MRFTSRPRPLVGWVLVFVAALALYAATAHRGAQWQDAGYFVFRALAREPVNPLGLALTHPLHYGLSRLAVITGVFEPALAVTLVSALAAALAVANVQGCALALGAPRVIALWAAVSLALANTYWQFATAAEVYTLTAALLSAETWCLIRFLGPASSWTKDGRKGPEHKASSGAFRGMFFFNGLGLANHNFAMLSWPVLAFAAVIGLRQGLVTVRSLLGAALLWLIGASPYLFLVWFEGVKSGDWFGTIQSALFGRFFQDEVLSPFLSAGQLAVSAGFVLLNFPNLLLPAAAWGIFGTRRRLGVTHTFLLAGLLIHVLFAFRYPVVDQHCFFLPSYMYLTLFAATGLERWANMSSDPSPRPGQRNLPIVAAWTLLILTPVFYAAFPALARRLEVLKLVARNKPYRDDYAYLFTPWSVSETSAEQMSREAVERAGEDGVIIFEDRMAEYALKYRALREGRPSLAIVNELSPHEFERAAQSGRPIVLVPRNADHPMTLPLRGTWRRQGDLYVYVPDE